MSGPLSANVQSVNAIKDVRLALINFQERATSAMGDLRQKIDRTVSWLELDRPNYWRDQERRAYDQLASTRTSLETCRLRTVAGRRSDCIEEKKAYERAKIRMEYVREKQQAVRKWMVQAEREANEYRARTSTFQRTLEHDVPMMIAQLNRMIDAIESYSEITPSIMASSPQVVSSADSSPSADSNPGDAVTDASSGLPSPAVEPAIQPQHSESEQKE